MVMQNHCCDAATISYETDGAIVPSNNHKDTATANTNKPMSKVVIQDLVDSMDKLQLGTYQREHVSNVTSCRSTGATPSTLGRQLFDTGLRWMMSYHHELAALYFHACIELHPHAALAHGLIALCHGPNYNFKGDLYYTMSNHGDQDIHLPDLQCAFPSQHVADRHSAAALKIIDELKFISMDRPKQDENRKGHEPCTHGDGRESTIDITNASDKGMTDNLSECRPEATPECITDVEVKLLSAIRILTGSPGVDPSVSDEWVGRPLADAMRSVYQQYPDDPDIAYFFAEALMVLNAWELYEYPSGVVLSPDVDEIREVLERALQMHKSSSRLDAFVCTFVRNVVPTGTCTLDV